MNPQANSSSDATTPAATFADLPLSETMLAAIAQARYHEPTPVQAGVIPAALTGIMGGIVAYVLMALGQRHTPPTLAGVLMSLESVFALIVSIAFGYDHLTLRTVAGFVLVFAGCTIARIGSERTPEYAAELAPPAP